MGTGRAGGRYRGVAEGDSQLKPLSRAVGSLVHGGRGREVEAGQVQGGPRDVQGTVMGKTDGRAGEAPRESTEGGFVGLGEQRHPTRLSLGLGTWQAHK